MVDRAEFLELGDRGFHEAGRAAEGELSAGVGLSELFQCLLDFGP